MGSQGYKVKKTKIYKDNQSIIKIFRNGNKFVSQQSRHISTKYFWIHILVEYCPTRIMLGDFFKKPCKVASSKNEKCCTNRATNYDLKTEEEFKEDRESKNDENDVKEISIPTSEITPKDIKESFVINKQITFIPVGSTYDEDNCT